MATGFESAQTGSTSPRHRAAHGPNGPAGCFPLTAPPAIRDPGRSRGISLIESVLTLATAALLIGTAVTMLTRPVARSRVTSGVNQIVADLAFSRSESLKRLTPVVLCESQDGASCTERPDWSNGWLIYTDENDNRDFDAGDILLRVQILEPGRQFVTYNGSGSLGYRYLTYHPDGSAKSGSFFVCDREHGTEARAVIVQYTGRPRVSHRTSDNQPIGCTTP